MDPLPWWAYGSYGSFKNLILEDKELHILVQTHKGSKLDTFMAHLTEPIEYYHGGYWLRLPPIRMQHY